MSAGISEKNPIKGRPFGTSRIKRIARRRRSTLGTSSVNPLATHSVPRRAVNQKAEKKPLSQLRLLHFVSPRVFLEG